MSDILSTIPTADLQALQAGDLTKVSTPTLQKLQRASMGVESPAEGGNTVLEGVGSAMASGVRALGGGALLEKFGLPGAKEEAEQLDAPLKETTGGKVGSVIGSAALAAPLALVPGANTYLGATALGALAGGALTEGDIGDRAQGAAFGAAGGAVGKAAGDGVGWAARWLADKRAASLAAQQAANTQKDAAAALAQKAGYVIPPADVKGGAVNEILNGLSGKMKTAQVASARNQGVTDELARKAIGLKAGDKLDAGALQSIRDAAARQGYAPVRAAGEVTADPAYTKALDGIVSQYQGASRSFPGAVKNEVQALIEPLKQAKFDAGDAVDMIRVLREGADKAFRQGDKGMGKASKAAADALEDQLERHLSAIGQPDALQGFRAARQLIAKTYSVQKGLNEQTGQVSAQALARQLEKGKPLSGELETIGKVAGAFPKATQSLKEAPKSVSPLDYAVAALGSGGGTNPAGLALLGARPAVRSVILSKPYQRTMMNNSYSPGFVDNVLLEALQSEPLKRALITGGATASL